MAADPRIPGAGGSDKLPSVTGPVLHCNETHVPDNGGAAKIKADGAGGFKGLYPHQDQGRFVGGQPTCSDYPGEPLHLMKSYPKHSGENAEIHGHFKSKFNGGTP